ncbi:anaerobic ribonucleoside-triphosphate reductase activating protein [[Pseudomonas] carboxydohydrogena]|uniref:Anaerobic ribonucleoside-triphosphate reductase activating protein n=1 Tax=Afipia carboxydohydrogena TaxID=290 RepID=A0ABY8BQH5_AFICR|nr:anaerobic ribonucleoside-triphosphate reductase activating protein [[Pseudomonas] carboxydohydrogena]WEF51791.1 anaerobic ribonucleoside-triphosphate reductase activating protein [[Pseudomonas] carboxydohydrogena]
MNAGSSAKRAPRSAELRVGGFVRLSTCDWPGELVATIFSQGCPWACSYCHNLHLIPPNAETDIAWQDVMSFLGSRRGLLDGVVFSGGEPTLQATLPEAMRAVRALGFRIGLHSAGPYPERLANVLPLIDWIGFDVKAAFDDYARITGVPGSGDKARESLRHVLASGVTCEIRTTVHTALLNPQQLAALASDLAAAGVVQHKIQPFRRFSNDDVVR